MRKSQIQALDRQQPVLPMMPGMPDVVRTTMCGIARRPLDVALGARHWQMIQEPPAVEFLKCLKEMAQVPLDVHILVYNYATHKTPKIKVTPDRTCNTSLSVSTSVGAWWTGAR